MRPRPRSGLLAGCALGALLATLPAVAQAQSFQGTPTVVTGDASITTDPGGIGVPATTTIDVLAPETVINWNTLDFSSTGNVVFQPNGTVATFNGDDLDDYTVLNRIFTLGPNGGFTNSTVTLDGTVESFVNPVGFGQAVGGQVWFYNPNGLIAGTNSVFNVGSLILTTNDIAFTPNDPLTGAFGSIYGPGGQVAFRGVTDSEAQVHIQAGAQINALGNAFGSSAYVAVVSSRVVQDGFVSADGNIAYVAGEEVDMTISGGLFDFRVLVGTIDEEGIVHRGTTTGPASVSFDDRQRIAMVALAKNDALTMLLQGTVGYTPAASAFNEGSSVVLAAGFDSADPFRAARGPGTIDIGPATFRNDVTAWASDSILLHPKGGTIDFAGNAFLNASSAIDVNVQTRENLLVEGNLSLTAGVPGQGGTITVLAENADFLPGGLIDVTGTFNLDASSYGILPDSEPPADNFGGTVTITADGGIIEAGNLYAYADGYGLFGDPTGGIGDGGEVNVFVQGLGTIQADRVELFAQGFGGNSNDTGGIGLGGEVTLTEQDGTLAFGDVVLSAAGGGGSSRTAAGDGFGGSATVTITQQAQDWTSLIVDTSGIAGARASESDGLTGSGTGGATGSVLSITGPGALLLSGDLALISNAYMGVNGVAGFTGQAGNIDLTVSQGGELTVGGTLYAHASALFGDADENPSTTPTQFGGQIAITADGGNIFAGALDARADAYGMAGLLGAGSATGGTVTVTARNDANIRVDDGVGSALAFLSANAFGAPGPSAADAFGGTTRLIAEDGFITVSGNLEMSASGLQTELFDLPLPGEGFTATGGLASIELLPGSLGTAFVAADDLTLSATADNRLFVSILNLVPGEDPIVGDAGDATGGTARITVDAGDLSLRSAVLDSSAAGGTSAPSAGLTAFQSGNGTGGLSELTQNGGAISVLQDIELISNGTGGGGGPGADTGELAALAGAGTGGTAQLNLNGGSLMADRTFLTANGIGGAGMNHDGNGAGSNGGAGTGGTAALTSAFDWTGDFTTAQLTLLANGVGGVGGFSAPTPGSPPTIPPMSTSGDGGDGTGGLAAIDLADGELSLGFVSLEANGRGGDSGDPGSGLEDSAGGRGFGGDVRFTLIDSAGPSGLPGTRTLDSLYMDASGYFGTGSIFSFSGEAGTAFLDVAVLDAASALSIAGPLSIYADGVEFDTSGITAVIAGAPLDVGGSIDMSTGGRIQIMADQPLRAATSVRLNGLSVDTTGLLESDQEMQIGGYLGVHSTLLRSGGTTSLSATNGPLYVGDLLSAGQVTAFAQSVEIHSPGALDFLFAHATAGDLWLETQLDLDVTDLSAAGSAMLESNAGAISTGNLTAGTWLYVDAFATASLGNLEAGTDAAVTTRGGNLTVGDVTAGDDIWLSVFGTDPAALLTAGNLGSTGLGDDLADGPPELFGGPGPAGNVVRVRSSGSLETGNISTAGGPAILVADNGTMDLGIVSGGGGVLLFGSGDIALDGVVANGPDNLFYVADQSLFALLPPDYDPASLAGVDPVRTGGNVTVAGLVDVRSLSIAAGGDIVLPNVIFGGTAFFDAGGSLDIDSLSAGGPIDLFADDNADIQGTGALAFTTAQAGNAMSIQTPGNLSFSSVLAGGNLTLRSTGGALSATGNVAGGATQLGAAGNVTIGGALTASGPLSVSAGGLLSVTGAASGTSANLSAGGGIDLSSLTSGGSTQLLAANGAVDVDQLLSTGPITARGRMVEIDSTGALTFADLDATAGDLSVTAVGNITLFSGEGGGLDSVTAFGDASLVSSDGSVTIPRPIIAGGSVTLDGHDGVAASRVQAGAGAELHSAAGTVDIDQLMAAGLVNVTAGNSVFIGGSGSLTFGTAQALNNLSITTDGDLTVGTVSSGLDLVLGSTGGSLTATGDISGIYGNLSAANDILLQGNLGSGGNLSVTAGGTFTALGETYTGDASISADGGITMNVLTTGEATNLMSADGDIFVGNLLASGFVVAQGRNVDISSTGSLRFFDVTGFAGDVLIDVADNLSIGGAYASQQMLLQANGTFTLTGQARANVIDIASGDIVLGDEAQLGQQDGTQRVVLRNIQSETLTYIGGDGGPDEAWNLDADEIGRIFADETIAFLADADITVDDFGLSFGTGATNIGAGGTLEISTLGGIDVIGDVALTTQTAEDTVVFGSQAITLDTSTGSIRLRNGSTPTGRLVLHGGTVAAATGTVLDQLGGLTDLDAITELLDQPGASGDSLEAGAIDVSVSDGFYVQNSGESDAIDDRRGFAAGSLDIETESAETRIAINGQILTQGGAVTGFDTQSLVTINGAPAAPGGQFAPRSTINGCIIGDNCAFVPVEPPNNEDLTPFDPDGPPSGFIVAPLIELAGTDPLITPPLVDEPITGVGNDDLWQPPCDEEDENAACVQESAEP